MPQRKGNPDRDFSADYKAAFSAELLPPYELDPDVELLERMRARRQAPRTGDGAQYLALMAPWFMTISRHVAAIS